MRRILGLCLLASVVGLTGSTPATAATYRPTRPATVQVSAFSATPSVSPVPVRGTDGRIHMPYELLVVNFGSDPATIASVQAVNARRPSRVLDSLTGADVAAHFMIAAIGGSSPAEAVIGPGQEGIVWLDATVSGWSSVPRRIVHRIRVTYPKPQAGGLIPADVTVTGAAPTRVSTLPVPILRPPLAGPRWFDANGCCSVLSSHRGAVNPVNASTNFPERTAIDFVQLNAQYRLFTGDATKISSYAYYGTPVMAATDGTVVAMLDGLPNQVPTTEPPLGALPLVDFGGNHVIEKFYYAGHVYYAYYGHMAPGSVSSRVHVGEHVHAGQVIGQLGDSGNSAAPHLHFQVMDRPSALVAQGLPYEFNRFFVRGRAADEDVVDNVLAGLPLQFDPTVKPGPRFKDMPLNLDLVDFTGRP